MLTRPEVLAPAGSPEAMRAALAAGADAVYFGLQDGFNARARATNFSLENLPATVAEIHRAGARAYLTLNTLVFEVELPQVEALLRRVIATGVDALIVQDPAVCLIAHALAPELELHASTQMTIASPRAAQIARRLFVTRVVVPRELSTTEIAKFRAGTDLELEVFIHGALCVSWSGQCLTSEAFGGRSANRGLCSQECRMPYELVLDGDLRHGADIQYLLSPKDLAGVGAVEELARIGVHGLKIEGRQKGPQYVSTAVTGYRRWVDAIVAGSDRKTAKQQLAKDLLAMELSYSRGFSPGFLNGSDHQTLVEGRFPKHRGVYLGTVTEVLPDSVRVRREARAGAVDLGTAPIQVRAGMGIVFDQGHPESKSEPGGPVFFVRERGEELVLGFGRPGPDLGLVRLGDLVWVTSDPALAHSAEPRKEGRIPLTLVVRGTAGSALEVVASGRSLTAAAASSLPLEVARGGGLGAEILREKLGAFGGTPFHLEALDVGGLASGLHLPVSELKEVRRKLVQDLDDQVARGPVRTIAAAPALPALRPAAEPAAAASGPALLVPLVRSDAQLEAALAFGSREVELDWMELVGLQKAVERVRAAGVRVVVATLRIGKPGEEAIDERLLRLQPDGLLVRHWGALVRAQEARAAGQSFVLHGDFALNVTNSVTARFLFEQGLDTLTASFDLDEAQLFALLEHVPAARLAVVVQHRIPTFHTEHCVYAHLLSEGRDYRSCGRPCDRHQVALQDHKGRRHPVLVDAGCRNTVFHSQAQSTAPWVPKLLEQGVRRLRVEFVREDAAETEDVLVAWSQLLLGKCSPASVDARTKAVPAIGVGRGEMKLLG